MMRIKMIKIKTLLYFLIFIFCCNSLFSQSIDKLGKITVFLKKDTLVYNANLRKFEIMTRYGSGFIIKHEKLEYIVTAKHVASFMDSTSRIVINKNKTIKEISFDNMIDSTNTNKLRWFYHPIADIAIHPILLSNDNREQLHLYSSDIRKNKINVKLLSDAIILGFPLGLGVLDNISPLAKKINISTYLTTIDHPKINPNLNFYLLDQALAMGYSGSPVFYIEEIPSGIEIGGNEVTKDSFVFLGIQSMVLSDNGGGKISLIVPNIYLWEIFNSAELNEWIRNNQELITNIMR